MADARILREITDALRVLKDRADAAGSPKVRAILTMTLESVKQEAEAAGRDASPPRRPGEAMRRIGEA